MARAEAYLHAEFHLDPSNCLTTVYERHRQDRQTGQERQRTDSIGRTVLQTVAQKREYGGAPRTNDVDLARVTFVVRPHAGVTDFGDFL